ncbi:XdhC family protein [Ulvibacterium marinum]|uniref:XdhC family protein n=1 Tax=Ulvibacterium marinum TaxID=2419782 RepID=UPI0024946069|nr:XdhC/CoxI family protein [Ulvibacterium marinum]
MTHELKKIVEAYREAHAKGVKTVLATVVALKGSSYRRPGVSMLIREDGQMIGAVSGGCVEKEVFRQSDSVFRTQIPKVMTYDGRYRLGCEGILYILIEPFRPSSEFLDQFFKILKDRTSFRMLSYFEERDMIDHHLGSVLQIGSATLPFRDGLQKKREFQVFEQKLTPCFKLLIIGAEHDAVQLCSYASLTGWEVTIVAPPSEEKRLGDFPGAQELLTIEPETLPVNTIDETTAIVIMTHSYVKDLKYLMVLKATRPTYLGLLGPAERREKLLAELIERLPEIDEDFVENIHGPTGLDIGAETAQEIAIAILAEVLSVARGKKPISLRKKQGSIHS